MPTARRTPQPPRLRSFLWFVGIVWAVAASFIGFELIALHAGDLLLGQPSRLGGLALSKTIRESRTCVVDGSGATPSGSPEARASAWLMGLKIGRDALARQYASVDRALLGSALDEVDALARSLGVPTPSAFTPRQVAHANTEFPAFVAADTSETARQLALRHSPQACQLYKLGAMWGYAMLVRPLLPGERAVYAAEIRLYAGAAGLPELLWEPMIERTRGNASYDEIAKEANALTGRVTEHLGSTR
jgi:hypothetical protein